MTYQSELTASNVQVVELFELTLKDATVVRLHNANVGTITFGGQSFTKAPILRTSPEQEAVVKTGYVRVTIGLSDEMRAIFDVDDVRHNRILDRATLVVYRVIMPDATTSAIDFKGFTGTVDVTNQFIEIEFKDMLFLLNKNLPSDLYAEGCNHIIGGTKCALSLAGVKVTGTAEAGSDADTLVDAINLVAANGYFERGYVTMSSGDNDGLSTPVITYVTGTATLQPPFPNAIGVGDTFTIYPHCQKSYDGCDTLHDTDYFLGFEYMPTKEQVNG